jgi:dTDP-4-amino-4,6-dideoxygalactose transaminase
LNAIAKKYDALMVEDACQAHGARINTDSKGWVRAGAFGAASAFSFYPGKNLGGWGEGGAIAVDDPELKARLFSLRDHGRISHYAHQEIGYNARLDAIQSAVLRSKLEKLDEWNGRRRAIAKMYRELLADTGVQLPVEPEGYESVYHLYVIRTEKRDAIRQALLENNIGCGIHYPLPLHLQPACRYLGYKSGDFPNAERIADTALSLPMHPALSPGEVEQVVSVVRDAIKKESSLFAGGRSQTVTCEPPPTCGG